MITIGDRTVTGMVTRDQMVGPWQVPVADVAVTTSAFEDYCGEAMAIGERTPLALLDAPASGRMAIAEAITNIVASSIEELSDIKLSANWMAPGRPPRRRRAFVRHGKNRRHGNLPATRADDSGRQRFDVDENRVDAKDEHGNDTQRAVTAPLSLIITAFAPVTDVRKTLTPQLRTDKGATQLRLIDLGNGKNRLGGSALAQTCKQIGDVPPDLDDVEQFKLFFESHAGAEQCRPVTRLARPFRRRPVRLFV